MCVDRCCGSRCLEAAHLRRERVQVRVSPPKLLELKLLRRAEALEEDIFVP
jgi:hypothetical protein